MSEALDGVAFEPPIADACHGWSDASFNDLCPPICFNDLANHMFADTYPEGNKVPANTYRAKRMIHLVSMKLKKFHAYTNHSTLYQGKYMRTCKAICTATRVGTKGMPVVARTWMTRDPREAKRRRRPSRSRFLRMRKKRATCRGKVLPYQCGTSL